MTDLISSNEEDKDPDIELFVKVRVHGMLESTFIYFSLAIMRKLFGLSIFTLLGHVLLLTSVC